MIASTDLLTIEGADHYDFGLLSSSMHMTWVKAIGGRFKSDPRYSATLVYNTFPRPREIDSKQRAVVSACARAVEQARAKFLPPVGASTMGDLYDPLTMPAALADAHAKLDRAVERCYRKRAFAGDRDQLAHLMAMYEMFVMPAQKKSRAETKAETTLPPKPIKIRQAAAVAIGHKKRARK